VIFETDVHKLNGTVDERVAVLAQVAQIDIFALQVFQQLSAGILEVTEGHLAIGGYVGGRNGGSVLDAVTPGRILRMTPARSRLECGVKVFDQFHLLVHDLDDDAELLLHLQKVHDKRGRRAPVQAILQMAQVAGVSVG